MSQSQRLGLEAQAGVGEAAVTGLMRAFVTPADQLEGAPAELHAMGDLWNALKIVNPRLPEPPTQADLRRVAAEFIDRRTIDGARFTDDPTHQKLLAALNGKVPTRQQLNAIGGVVREAVQESTGDTEFLGGLKWSNLLEALMQGLMKWIESGFKGGLKGLFDSIKVAGFEITRGEAVERTREGLNALVQNGTITPEMADRAIAGVGEGMTARAHGSGLPVAPPATVVPLAGLIAGHERRDPPDPSRPVTRVDTDAISRLPADERVSATLKDIANNTINAVLGTMANDPKMKPKLDAARDTFARIGAERAKQNGALNNAGDFADATLRATILDLANNPEFSSYLDTSTLGQVQASDSWEQVLDKLSQNRDETNQLRDSLLIPLRNQVAGDQFAAIRNAAGLPVDQAALRRAQENQNSFTAESAQRNRDDTVRMISARMRDSRPSPLEIGQKLTAQINVEIGLRVQERLDNPTSRNISGALTLVPGFLLVEPARRLLTRVGEGNNGVTRAIARRSGETPSEESKWNLAAMIANRVPAIMEEEMIKCVGTQQEISAAELARRVRERFSQEFDAAGNIPGWTPHRERVLATIEQEAISSLTQTTGGRNSGITMLNRGLARCYQRPPALPAAPSPAPTPPPAPQPQPTPPPAPGVPTASLTPGGNPLFDEMLHRAQPPQDNRPLVPNVTDMEQRAADFAALNRSTAPGANPEEAPLPPAQFAHGLAHEVRRSEVAGVGIVPGPGGFAIS